MRGDEEGRAPLYALPPRDVRTAGGDSVAYTQPRGMTEIKLHTRAPATGSKLYAIRSLQLACSISSGDLGRGRPARDGITWHTFRIQDGDLLEVHRAVVGIAEGEHGSAVAYVEDVERLTAAVLEELRAA